MNVIDKKVEQIAKLLDEKDVQYNYSTLKTIIDKHFTEKVEWMCLLGLDETNDFKRQVDLIDRLDNKPAIKELLVKLKSLEHGNIDIQDANYFKSGKNIVRVSKYITKWFDILAGINPQRCSFYINNTLDAARYDVYRFWDEYNADKDFAKHKFLCLYGDIIKNGRVGYISVDPYDYFTMSGVGTTYSSCVAIGDAWMNTINHYLNSDCVFLSYVKEKTGTKKIGRSLIYLGKDLILQSGIYGSFYESDERAFRIEIEHLLGGRWIISACNGIKDYVINESNAYIDSNYGTVTYRKDSSPAPVLIKSGFCLTCGHILDTREYGNCDRCYVNYTCEICSERTNNESGICDSCYKNTDCCRECGTRSKLVNLTFIGDYYYCAACCLELFTYCGICNEWTFKDNTTLIIDVDIYACNECLKDYDKCYECDDFFKTTYVTGDNITLCKRCYENCYRCECEEVYYDLEKHQLNYKEYKEKRLDYA
jgi:hypothetical protein